MLIISQGRRSGGGGLVVRRWEERDRASLIP